MEPREQLRAMITGLRRTAALSVAAELGISDEVAEAPLTVDALAARVGADEDALRRLLRVLVALGVYDEDADGRYGNTGLGDLLRSDVPGTMRWLARTFQDPATWGAWGHLAHSVRTGDNAFEALNGVDVWAYRAAHPQANAVFNATMAALTSRMAAAVAAAHDFAGLSTVVDVGGGDGVLLEAVLQQHAHLTGAVFDLPQALPSAPSAGAAAAIAARWSAISGSFFEAVPSADAHLLKKVLHDWPDDRCIEILTHCRHSLTPGGVVLVVETVLDRPGRELEAALSDLNMLVMPGGRERTTEEFGTLFAAAGLHLSRVIDTDTEVVILEGVLDTGR